MTETTHEQRLHANREAAVASRTPHWSDTAAELARREQLYSICIPLVGPPVPIAVAAPTEPAIRPEELAARLGTGEVSPARVADARAHLGAALMQALPEDDQIIIGHVRSALRALDAGWHHVSRPEVFAACVHAGETYAAECWENLSDEARRDDSSADVEWAACPMEDMFGELADDAEWDALPAWIRETWIAVARRAFDEKWDGLRDEFARPFFREA